MSGKQNSITVVHNFGGKRQIGEPSAVASWSLWDCDPTKPGVASRKHSFGKEFPWIFEMNEKAYIIEGSATLTADDE